MLIIGRRSRVGCSLFANTVSSPVAWQVLNPLVEFGSGLGDEVGMSSTYLMILKLLVERNGLVMASIAGGMGQGLHSSRLKRSLWKPDQ